LSNPSPVRFTSFVLRQASAGAKAGRQALSERYLIFAAGEGFPHSSGLRRTSADLMFYVYVMRSLLHPKRYYIGFTENIDQRVKEHNEGKSLHTSKYEPWELAAYLAVPSKTKALDLERYLISSAILSQAQDGHFCSAIFFVSRLR
jgi:putative endonuclease